LNIEKHDFDKSSDYSEITSEGMINKVGIWIQVKTTVYPLKETEKAYYAMMRVDEIVDGEPEDLYDGQITSWIPKSMVSNVWWICTNKFGEEGRVSNKVFDKSQSNSYDPFEAQKESREFS